MRFIPATATALACCLAIGACVPSTPKPTPTPSPVATPTPRPAPVPTPTPVPTYSSWMDFPLTPGDWRYDGGLAQFGAPVTFSMRCDRASGAVELRRAGQSSAGQMIVRSEALERSVPAAAARGDAASLVARVPTGDPLLDAMAFSKGRFAIEVDGLPTLYVPSYPEVTRVIEDCR